MCVVLRREFDPNTNAAVLVEYVPGKILEQHPIDMVLDVNLIKIISTPEKVLFLLS